MPNNKAATTEKEEKDFQDEEGKQREIELSDIRHVLNSDQGTRFAKRLIEQGGLFKVEFTGNSKVHFNEGMRNFSLWVFNEIITALEDHPDLRGKIAEVLLNKEEV